MFRRKPTKEQLQEAVVSEYTATLEQQQGVLTEAIHDAYRTVNMIANEGEPRDEEVRAEAREFLHPDLYDRIAAAAADNDAEAIADSLDRLIGRLLASFHQEVLYPEALDRASKKRHVQDSSELWADESEQDALQGRMLSALRPFATPGAWAYVIDAVSQDFGADSAFVKALEDVRDEEGLPSLLEQ